MNWYVFFFVAWLAWGFGRLYPMKKRLRREFGADKPDSFFAALAKSGHAPARRLIRETRVFIWVGIIGGALTSFNRALPAEAVQTTTSHSVARVAWD